MYPLEKFSPHLTLMEVRKLSHKILNPRVLGRNVKSPIFSTISFAAIFLLIYAAVFVIIYGDSVTIYEDIIISNVFAYRAKENSERPQSKVGGQNKSVALLSVQEEIGKADTGSQNPLKPPSNLTEEERIAWFRKKLPEIEIFKSDNLTRQFHGRVIDFFNQECEVQTFMTWISPAKCFGRRESLVVETLFKAHPKGCLMILSRTLDSAYGYRVLKPLLDRKLKAAAVTPDLKFLFKNTPAEAWFEEMKSGNKDPGHIPLSQNLSNLIRLVVLYKYGGVYLDTDFIILKSFKGLRNSIGAQSLFIMSKNWKILNNAVLVFDRNHPLLYRFIEEFVSTFNGNKWGYNGPFLVSRVVKRVGSRPGYNFTILPPMAFYPVDWNRIRRLFQMPKNQASSKWVNATLLELSGETYGVHLWNKHSRNLRIEEGSVMGRMISDHCLICEDIYTC